MFDQEQNPTLGVEIIPDTQSVQVVFLAGARLPLTTRNLIEGRSW